MNKFYISAAILDTLASFVISCVITITTQVSLLIGLLNRFCKTETNNVVQTIFALIRRVLLRLIAQIFFAN